MNTSPLHTLLQAQGPAFTEIQDTPQVALPQTAQTILEDNDLGRLLTAAVDKPRIDYAAPADHCQVLGNKFLLHGNDGVTETDLTPYAHRQLLDRLCAGMNTTYQKIHAEGMDSRLANFESFTNHMLNTCGKAFTIRTLKNLTIQTAKDRHGAQVPESLDRTRAVLSNGFLCLDDDFVLDAALPVIDASNMKFKLLGGNVGDHGMYLKFISREPAFEVNDNGRIRAFHIGFVLSNNEVGQGYCKFEAFCADAFCWNGCIWKSMEIANAKFAHRGSAISTDFPDLIGDEVRASRVAEHKNLITKAADIACSNVGHTRMQESIQNSIAQKAGETTEETIAVINNVAKEFNLGDTTTQTLQRYAGNESPTRFGVQAAVTRLAQDAKTPEARIELESAGGTILSNDRLWKAVTNLS